MNAYAQGKITSLLLISLLFLMGMAGFARERPELQKARKQLRNREYKEAIQVLQNFIKANPPAPNAPQAPGDWKPLARAHFLLARAFAVSLDIKDPKVLHHLTQTYTLNIDFNEVVTDTYFEDEMKKAAKKVLYMEYKNQQGFLERRFRQGIVMIQIPEGEFKMGYRHGDSDEQPVHGVRLDTYWIGKYEVSMGQYKQFILQAKHRSLPSGISAIGLEDGYPVVGVSWDDAMDYCRWLSGQTGSHFTLPTEAQWEKAARGTGKGKRVYPWGDHSPKCKWASYKGCVKRIRTVRSCEPGKSPYGAHHMAGNVHEWCRDWYAMDYYQKSLDANPRGPEKGDSRVFRGGSFNDDKLGLRSAKRHFASPKGRGDFLGFRLCMKEQ